LDKNKKRNVVKRPSPGKGKGWMLGLAHLADEN
jgi:hypothetical protein